MLAGVSSRTATPKGNFVQSSSSFVISTHIWTCSDDEAVQPQAAHNMIILKPPLDHFRLTRQIFELFLTSTALNCLPPFLCYSTRLSFSSASQPSEPCQEIFSKENLTRQLSPSLCTSQLPWSLIDSLRYPSSTLIPDDVSNSYFIRYFYGWKWKSTGFQTKPHTI